MNQVKKITTEQTYAIRKEVLRKGIEKPCKFDGDFDTHTFHLGVFTKDKLIGVTTLMKRNCEFFKGTQYQLRGMAILSEGRGEGFGNLLIEAMCKELKNKNIGVLWCNAREVAVGFYQKNGFEVIEIPFEITEIGTHYKMFKRL